MDKASGSGGGGGRGRRSPAPFWCGERITIGYNYLCFNFLLKNQLFAGDGNDAEDKASRGGLASKWGMTAGGEPAGVLHFCQLLARFLGGVRLGIQFDQAFVSGFGLVHLA